MSPDSNLGSIKDARSAVLQLLDQRTNKATVCPSEVARAIVGKADADPGGSSWRLAMPLVHAAIDQLADDGSVELSWKGKRMASRSGPYRISRAEPTS